MGKDNKDMTAAGSSSATGFIPNSVSYRDTISCIRPFDGTRAGYSSFVHECERAFIAIEPKSYNTLLNYVLSRLDVEKFPMVLGSNYTTWTSIKKALDEHFGIRLTEKQLYKDVVELKRDVGEDLFTFYNRLVFHSSEYDKFIWSTLEDPHLANFKINTVQEHILDKFILEVGMNLRPTLKSFKPKDIREAYQQLRELEMDLGCKSADNMEVQLAEVLHLLKETKVSIESDSSKRFVDPKISRNDFTHAIMCQLCDREGHTAKKCKKETDESDNSNNNSNNRNNNSRYYNYHNNNSNNTKYSKRRNNLSNWNNNSNERDNWDSNNDNGFGNQGNNYMNDN